MHNIRQFKSVLYIVILLGITGYSVAAETPGLWALGCAAVLLHAWLAKHGRFRPMPRLLTNIVTLGALLFVLRDLVIGGTAPVLVVGEFLVLLQLVKLWEQRTNRDYVQLLLLGLLLMVSAAISTASLAFCLILGLWLFVALYCCLLFHLKTEADLARSVLGVPEDRQRAATARQDEQYLPRSMRRLTGFAAFVGLCFGVFVFLVFPRGSGGMFGPLQWRAAQALVGFSNEVNFQNIAKIQQNNEPVAYVRLFHNNEPVNGTEELLLRGSAFDTYNGISALTPRFRYRWLREVNDPSFDMMILSDRPRNVVRRRRGAPPPPDLWKQEITLRPTGTNVLFSMGGVQSVRTVNRSFRLQYFRRYGTMECLDPLVEPLEYEVTATGELPTPAPTSLPTPAQVKERMANVDRATPNTRAFALRPEVSGRDANGPLAAQREKDASGTPVPVSKFDEAIARHIEQYLRRNYQYTLDLTDTRRIEGRDPLEAFLLDFKKGHCEYFAGSMTQLCQSLGLQARMVAGFRADADAFVNGYYVVQQSHAHTWVEVLTTDGKTLSWKTFDPTSSTDAAAHHASLVQRMRTFWNYLDFTYANSVVAFDSANQSGFWQTIQGRALNAAYRLTARLDPIRRQGFGKWVASWFTNADNANIFWTICRVVFIALMTICLLGAFAWFVLERLRLRRRAARIGIGLLPTSEKLRLAKQLGFYDELLKLLARHRMIRQPHQTPLEFSRSLLYLPAETYDTIVRLTELFYRVRFGRAELTPERRRHVTTALGRLGELLGSARRRRTTQQ